MDFELKLKSHMSTQKSNAIQLKSTGITPPESILNLGLRHAEQISLF